MELTIGNQAATEGAEDCEIYGGEYPDIDIDLQNQQTLYFSQQNMVSKVSGNPVHLDREIVTEPINFQSSIAKFT